MLSKRIIPCLDVRGGKLTKGVKFQGEQIRRKEGKKK